MQVGAKIEKISRSEVSKGKVNGVKSISFLCQLEGFYVTLGLKILEKLNHDFAGIHFRIVASVLDATFLKNIVESESGSHLPRMSLAFSDAPHSVIF